MEEYNYNEHLSERETQKSNSIVKVFGYMFLGLLITAGVSYGLFAAFINSAISPETYLTLVYVSGIATIIIMIIDRIILMREKIKAGLIGYALFAISMGAFLSTIYLAFEASTVAVALAVCASTFGVMALYGYFTKRNLASFGMFAVGLLWGILILSMVNWFLHSEMIYWVIEYVGLAAMLGITAWDVNKSKIFIESGRMTEGLSILLAIELYTDFIYIFLRILAIVAKSKKR